MYSIISFLQSFTIILLISSLIHLAIFVSDPPLFPKRTTLDSMAWPGWHGFGVHLCGSQFRSQGEISDRGRGNCCSFFLKEIPGGCKIIMMMIIIITVILLSLWLLSSLLLLFFVSLWNKMQEIQWKLYCCPGHGSKRAFWMVEFPKHVVLQTYATTYDNTHLGCKSLPSSTSIF